MKYTITFSDMTPEQVNLLGNAIAEGLNWKAANPFMAARAAAPPWPVCAGTICRIGA